jgi:SAM-dependent MidA family methyltransferase
MQDPEAGGMSREATEWIRARIVEHGPVTMAQFIEWALYHPNFGYYATGPEIGPRGDFTTSPEASPLFGRLLARHVADIDELLGRPDSFNLIECGPGLGTMALDLLDEVESAAPDMYRRLRYRLVEISRTLTRLQREHLVPKHSGAVEWFEGLDDLPAGLDGAVLANEVVDAFPVHVLEHRGPAGIQEQYVEAGGADGLAVTYGAPSRPELIGFLKRYGVDLAPGQRAEINLAAADWIGQAARVLGRGIATIIDYGDTSPARYSSARREGTLLGYHSGSVTDNLLARPGEQDLTTLVDFTALQDAARSTGFEPVELTRQANFLLGLGLGTAVTAEDLGNDLQSVLAARRRMQALISPEGLGRFHVLLLARGVDPAVARAKLSGLRFANIQ